MNRLVHVIIALLLVVFILPTSFTQAQQEEARIRYQQRQRDVRINFSNVFEEAESVLSYNEITELLRKQYIKMTKKKTKGKYMIHCSNCIRCIEDWHDDDDTCRNRHDTFVCFNCNIQIKVRIHDSDPDD